MPQPPRRRRWLQIALLATGLNVGAIACSSSDVPAAVTESSTRPAQPPIQSRPFPAGDGEELAWSGAIDGQAWTLSTRRVEGERCVILDFAEPSRDVCAVPPAPDSNTFEPIIALVYQLAPDELASIVVGLVPPRTSSITMIGSEADYVIFLDEDAGVFLIQGPASGLADKLRLAVGGDDVDCTILGREVRDLAYVC
jgi:hypothetical protein